MTAPTASAPPTSSMIRPAIALLAGLGVSILIIAPVTVFVVAMMHGAGYPQVVALSPSGLAVLLAVNALGAFAGGFVTARITEGRSFYTTFVLALVLFTSAMVPVLRGAEPANPRPRWFLVGMAIAVLVSALMAGFLERRRQAAR
jgi:hypothetical protein